MNPRPVFCTEERSKPRREASEKCWQCWGKKSNPSLTLNTQSATSCPSRIADPHPHPSCLDSLHSFPVFLNTPLHQIKSQNSVSHVWHGIFLCFLSILFFVFSPLTSAACGHFCCTVCCDCVSLDTKAVACHKPAQWLHTAPQNKQPSHNIFTWH